MEKLHISVLGCGWLGMPLLISLVADGHVVKGTSRNPETLVEIGKYGGAAFAVDLPEELPSGFTDGCNVLIITLPPGGRRLGAGAEDSYLKSLSSLGSWLGSSAGPAVIYTSSTGVYGNTEGIVTEETEPRPATHSSRAVLSAERYLASCGCPLTVLRLAGLVAADRHPGRFFGGKDRPVTLADSPVNLVHRKDVISAVKLFLGHKERLPGIYNVCAGAHPAKGDFYTAAARSLGLDVNGTEPGGAEGKKISSQKLRDLGWRAGWDDLDLKALKVL